jgi:hypothetical protein
MMRPALLNSRREQRASRRRERRRAARAPWPTPVVRLAPTAAVIPTASHALDLAVERVREAGGPIDRASYACGCGYLFEADVSTTVSCPNCGGEQAW